MQISASLPNKAVIIVNFSVAVHVLLVFQSLPCHFLSEHTLLLISTLLSIFSSSHSALNPFLISLCSHVVLGPALLL
jgi:hypothetical protein